MIDIHNIVEFVMIFIIAYLFSHHLQLKQEYETLKALRTRDAKCQCYNSQGVNPMMQSSTVPNLLTIPSESQQSQGVYWVDSDTSSSSRERGLENQGQITNAIISSSYPPSLVANPKETGTADLKVSDQSILTSRFNEMKAAVVPETETVPDDKIPQIQSSMKILSSSTGDSNSKITTDFDPQYQPDSNQFSPPSSTDSLLVDKNTIQNVKADQYDLPSEQTSSPLNQDNDKTEIPLTTSTSGTEKSVIRNILETSVTSNTNHQEVTNETGAYKGLLQASTTLSVASGNDAVPSSTVAEDPYEDEHESMDDTFNIDDPFPSPHRPIPSHQEGEMDDDTRDKDTVDLNDFRRASHEDKTFLLGGSSAECHGHNPGKKHCLFKNICYNAKEKDFIFFKGPDSFIDSDGKLNVTGIFSLSLSTLTEHNTLMLSLITLPIDALTEFSVSMVTKKSIAITRFKPDNIMHVLHDDVLPLYHTLQYFDFPRKEKAFDTFIFFTDPHEDGDYIQFYSSLSAFKPLSLKKLNISQQLVCFANLHIGLLTSTVWYQYGFFKPQGPLIEIDKLAFSYVQEASQHIVKHFHSDCFLCKQKNYLVLLSRKDNRLILNEGELILALSKSTRVKVLSVSLERHSLAEIITIVRSSRGIIGMHGSLIAVSVFLPPGGVVIELFPFGVKPSRYTPFKTFADLPGSFLLYKSWVNTDHAKSIPHPDGIPEEGGINHLPSLMQKEIKSQTEVPEHLCCNDPSWLYHIYQDTYVNISAVASLTSQVLEAQSLKFSPPKPEADLPDIPGSVAEMHCVRNSDKTSTKRRKAFTVSWLPHWSLGYHPSPQNLKYVIIVQQKGSLDSHTENLAIDALSFSFGDFLYISSHSLSYNVWVTVVDVVTGVKSQSKHVICP